MNTVDNARWVPTSEIGRAGKNTAEFGPPPNIHTQNTTGKKKSRKPFFRKRWKVSDYPIDPGTSEPMTPGRVADNVEAGHSIYLKYMEESRQRVEAENENRKIYNELIAERKKANDSFITGIVVGTVGAIFGTIIGGIINKNTEKNLTASDDDPISDQFLGGL